MLIVPGLRPASPVLARDPPATVSMTPSEPRQMAPRDAAESTQPGLPADLTLIVLAAGGGTRMKSRLPKPFHPVAGRPMIEHVIRAGLGADPARVIAVLSEQTAGLIGRIDAGTMLTTVLQREPLGTGHAIQTVFDAGPIIPEAGLILVLLGDQPLLDDKTVKKLAAEAVASRAPVTLLTCLVDDAAAYGRVVRSAEGNAVGITEKKDDDDSSRVGVTEIWSGVMALDVAWSRAAIRRLTPSPASGELYLTELIGIAIENAPPGVDWPVQTVDAPPEIAHGVNTRVELAQAEAMLQRRIRHRWMLDGVTIDDPATVYIEVDVRIGTDTTLRPFTHLRAGTTIGRDCVIGPGSDLTATTVGDGVTIRSSTVAHATIHDGADIGPYSHLRAGTVVGAGVHVGNFGEFKNAHLAAGVKVGHFGYLGDVTVGEGTNIGAGTVVANFDGQRKHATTIGSGAFIGSDTVLRAPVTIGDGAATGAGSVVTQDVPAGVTVVGVPARPIIRRADTSSETPSGPERSGPREPKG